MASKPGSIVHVELHSADPAKSKAFYGEVFGWKFEEMPEMNYTMWRAENGPGGGTMQTREGRPPQVLNYILAESDEDTLRDTMGAGGILTEPRKEIPGQAWMALFRKPGRTTLVLCAGLRGERRRG